MNGHEFVTALRQGTRLLGTLIVSDSPRWPETVAKLGLDFVFIDTEHIAIDRKTLSWMCQAYRALGLPPIVRITSPDPYEATCALDGGACGIVVPYVETVEQVEALRGAVKLRPLKGERLHDALRSSSRLEPELARYLDCKNGESALIINIESRPALENLDRLLEVGGVDGVLIGPHDLSCSLGIPERYEDPRFDSAVREILRRARRHGIGAGIHSWMGIEQEIAWAEGPEGANFLIHEADIIAMRLKISADVAALRARLGALEARPVPAVDNL